MNSEIQLPIIVRIESQKVEREDPQPQGGHITTVRNIGFDADGQRWQFFHRHYTNPDGITTIGPDYGFVKL